MEEYKYPKKLVRFLEEQSSELNEIITTYNEDSTIFLITPIGLGNWIIIVEWFYGEDFSIINLNSRAFDRAHKVIHEIEKEEDAKG